MIPGEIFTSFAEFQGIVSVNDFSFLFGSKNFCKLLCVSCEVFVLHGYHWIHWLPSPAPRLRIDECFEIHNLH